MKFGNNLERYKSNETDKIRKDKYISTGNRFRLYGGCLILEELEHMIYDVRKSDIFMEREVRRQRALRLSEKNQQ